MHRFRVARVAAASGLVVVGAAFAAPGFASACSAVPIGPCDAVPDAPVPVDDATAPPALVPTSPAGPSGAALPSTLTGALPSLPTTVPSLPVATTVPVPVTVPTVTVPGAGATPTTAPAPPPTVPVARPSTASAAAPRTAPPAPAARTTADRTRSAPSDAAPAEPAARRSGTLSLPVQMQAPARVGDSFAIDPAPLPAVDTTPTAGGAGFSPSFRTGTDTIVEAARRNIYVIGAALLLLGAAFAAHALLWDRLAAPTATQPVPAVLRARQRW